MEDKKITLRGCLVDIYNLLAFFAFPIPLFLFILCLILLPIFGENSVLDIMGMYVIIGIASYFVILLPIRGLLEIFFWNLKGGDVFLESDD